MVWVGGWRSGRRRGYNPYGYGPGYGRRGYGGGNSCLRDMCLVESGCCAAELLGCGPQLALTAPSLIRRWAWPAEPPQPSYAGRSRPLRLALRAIAVYQQDISPRRRPCCRYSPSCSRYADQALEVHGLAAGTWLAARRLLRCRPGSPGGADPVPARRPAPPAGAG
ncbi:MAG: membrane protein insertion efficiency factor YidD [Actinomycetota bacterium]|nr:membrane protein insertion efficiency factor YidD [Actinomycetota bacterium]